MYATCDQIGQTIICPDCLESVVVPDRSPPPRKSASTPPSPQRASQDTSRQPDRDSSSGATDHDDAEDDLKLSEPIELPKHRSVSRKLSDLLDEQEKHSRSTSPSPPPLPPTSPASPPPAPVVEPPLPAVEFAVTCPVCDTRFYAREEDIGQQRECPDCYTLVVIERPAPKTKRVNDVVDADYEGEDFVLGAPVELDVYKSSLEASPKTMGEDALRRAERELNEQEQDASEVTGAPLWTGLFKFLPDPIMISRLIVSGLLVGGTLMVLQTTVHLATGNAVAQFAAVAGSIGTLVVALITLVLISANCLTILQETAHGHDRVDHWPENSPVEWTIESFPIGMALFFGLLPGMILFWITTALGMNTAASLLFIGISGYLFFPVVVLSILESASLTTPLSQPIWTTLQEETMLWAVFYIITFFMAVVIAVTITTINFQNPILWLLGLGVIWAFASFLYFRLLGRLAWTCQTHTSRGERRNQRADNESTEHQSPTDPHST